MSALGGFCTACGGRAGAHREGCREVARRIRAKAQAACHHDVGVTQTCGDPPGAPTCAKCGAPISDPRTALQASCHHEIVESIGGNLLDLACVRCGISVVRTDVR